MKKRVYIAYTGGTIGMLKNERGEYEPAPGYLGERMKTMPELTSMEMPEYTIHEYFPLLDSSNMMPDNWLTIARDIQAHYDDYDGFVILHGTDTMAYTASALAFMLRGRKTIILTGSQIPLCELRSDGRDNLITSLFIAGQYVISEVSLYFGGKLLRGCRATKISANGLEAFDSPNFPPLGTAGVDIQIFWDLVREPPAEENLVVQAFREPVVAALHLFPGIRASVIETILQPPLQGLVVAAYGTGNGPTAPEFLGALRRATERGVVVVAVTQCVRGAVHLGEYATSLSNAGVTTGLDMTIEAALAKLVYLFSLGHTPEMIREEMAKSLRGELVPEHVTAWTRQTSK